MKSDIVQVYCDYLFSSIYCKSMPEVMKNGLNIETQGILYKVNIVEVEGNVKPKNTDDGKNNNDSKVIIPGKKESFIISRRYFIVLMSFTCIMLVIIPLIIIAMYNKKHLINYFNFGNDDNNPDKFDLNLSTISAQNEV